MNGTEEKKLTDLACKLYSMTFVLKGYCENFDEEIPEISNLIEFSEILHKTSKKLFDLL